MNGHSLEQLMLYSLFGLGIAFLATFIAALMGFFSFPLKRYEAQTEVSTSTVVYTFGLFAGVKFFVAPALLMLIHLINSGQSLDSQSFAKSFELQGWFSVILSGLLAGAYLLYFYVINPGAREPVFGKSRFPLKEIGFGVLCWLIIYPWIFVMQHAIDYVAWHFYEGPQLEQVAVQQIRQVMAFPWLFWSLALLVVVVAPVIEEVLFRGVLQGWLKARVGTVFAIFVTSILFAFVHFADQQGVFNFSIIGALFVLALFLGFLRERQGTLLAPIGLHCTVNFVSFFMIILQEKLNETLHAPAACLFSTFWR